MSRLIVKNLPKSITEKKLRNLFEAHGTITDLQLKYTKEGVFRQFAFIGFRTEGEADTAIKYFNNACVQTSRIKVEKCATLGGEDKPQSWSRYSKDSNTFRKTHGIDEKENPLESDQKLLEGKTKKKNKLEEIIGDRKDDPKFVEFMEAHDKNRTLWANDAAVNKLDKTGDEVHTHKDIEELNESDERKLDHDESTEEEEPEEKLAEKPISDMEYMKSLVKSNAKNNKVKSDKSDIELYTIKIYNIPYKVRRPEILKFFKPLKPYSVRLPTKSHGFCYVGFKTERDFSKAMLKNKSFIKGQQVYFADFTEKNKISKAKRENREQTYENGKNAKWRDQEDSLKNEEDISESGRIFFRNLAYTVVEEDLQKLFETFGQVAEINLPVDNVTRQIKGFGTVTFVMPEHAVRAFSELDGSTFHGRLLHLIPGKKNKDEDDEEEEGLSWKEKKERKLKKAAQQTHNWNTLFLGPNAVADVMAKQYETSKENILDSQTGGSSAAVRLALGETQIVLEMKKFLEENGVCLDVFGTQSAKRSKTVILVKNLPVDTKLTDLQPLFAPFGPIGRFVFPPSGVTALVEYMDPSEARNAFKHLAYSQFGDVPLFLEWAPEGTFKTDTKQAETKSPQVDDQTQKAEKKKKKKKKNESQIEEVEVKKEEEVKEECKQSIEQENAAVSDDDDADEPPEPNTTLFIRNLNFNTREDAVRRHFQNLGPIHTVQVAMRKDPEDPKNKISLGYGFIQFKRNATLEKALKTMQFTTIEGNSVELKRSDRTLKIEQTVRRKGTTNVKQTGTKLLVRNIPFQAKVNEVRDIFKAFGEIRTIRLPLKTTPGEQSHRGFGFVDFLAKGDAKKAFDALGQSTHLYGRRLVLEWASTTDDEVEDIRKRTAQSFPSSVSAKRSKKGLFDMGNPDDDENSSRNIS